MNKFDGDNELEFDDPKPLKEAAAEVWRQVTESPGLGLPVDPEVADYMGAFEAPGVDEDDLLDLPAQYEGDDDGE
jgi:hypothetical protein